MEEDSEDLGEIMDPLDLLVKTKCFIHIKGSFGDNLWLELGRVLGINDESLARIESEYRGDTSEMAQQMYNEWMKRFPETATHRVLAEALEAVDRISLAIKVENCSCLKPSIPAFNPKEKETYAKLTKHLQTRYKVLTIQGNLEEELPIRNHFAELQYYQYDEMKHQKIPITNIFEEGDKGKRILLYGGNGSGKTTTAAKLLHDWGTSQAYMTKLFDLAILISGHDPSDTLDETLFNALEMDFLEKEDVLDVIRHPSLKLLLLIDDFERFADKKKRQLMTVIRKEYLKESTVVVISRSPSLHSVKSSIVNVSDSKHIGIDVNEFLECKVEVLGIADEIDKIQEHKIVQMFVKGNKSIAAQVKKVLYIWNEGVASIEIYPLFLTLLAQVLVRNANLSLTDIHREVYELLVHQYVMKEQSISERAVSETTKQDAMIKFGKCVFSNLINLSTPLDKTPLQAHILELGFHFRTVREDKGTSVSYVPIVKGLVEFAAAHYAHTVLLDRQSQSCSTTEQLAPFMRPCQGSKYPLYFTFLVGLMKEESTRLFEYLKPYLADHWYSFGKLGLSLMEISLTENIKHSILPLLPHEWKIPCEVNPWACLKRRYEEFHQSSLHEALLSFAVNKAKLSILRWDTCYAARLPAELEVDLIILELKILASNQRTCLNDTILKCEKLHCILSSNAQGNVEDVWSKFLDFIFTIKVQNISFEVKNEPKLWLSKLQNVTQTSTLKYLKWITCDVGEDIETMKTLTTLLESTEVKGLQLVIAPSRARNSHFMQSLQKLIKIASESDLNRLVIINKGQAISISWPILCRRKLWKWIQLTDVDIQDIPDGEECSIKISNLDLSPSSMSEKTSWKVLNSIKPEVKSLICSSSLLVTGNIGSLQNCITGIDIKTDVSLHEKNLASLLSQFPNLDVLALSVTRTGTDDEHSPFEKWLQDSDKNVSLKGLEIWGTEADMSLAMKLVNLIEYCLRTETYSSQHKKRTTGLPDLKLKLKYLMLNIGSPLLREKEDRETIEMFMEMAKTFKKSIKEKVLPELHIVIEELHSTCIIAFASTWIDAFPPSEGFSVSQDYWGSSADDCFRSKEAFDSCPVECCRFRIKSSAL